MKGAIDFDDGVVDPGVRPFGRGLRAGPDHGLERRIEGDAKGVFLQGPLKPFRHMESVQRQDSAEFRIHPEKAGGIAAFRHRKNSGGVSAQQQFRLNLHARIFARERGGV